MTPETEQVPADYARQLRLPPSELQFPVRAADAPVRSDESIVAAERARAAARTREAARARAAARTGPPDAKAMPPPTRPEQAAPAPVPVPVPVPAPVPAGAARARADGSIVSVIPYLAVLIVTIAGVYVAWHQGSAGAGRGGVVSGVALLAAAVLRLVLPARLAGLLGTRNRVIDVLTLTVFGGGLLAAGLVLPH